MNPLWLSLVPVAFVAGFYVNAYLTKGTIDMITADFQAQIDRLNASASAEATQRQAAVKAATEQAATDAADNLNGVTQAADAVAAAVGA